MKILKAFRKGNSVKFCYNVVCITHIRPVLFERNILSRKATANKMGSFLYFLLKLVKYLVCSLINSKDIERRNSRDQLKNLSDTFSKLSWFSGGFNTHVY